MLPDIGYLPSPNKVVLLFFLCPPRQDRHSRGSNCGFMGGFVMDQERSEEIQKGQRGKERWAEGREEDRV